MKTRNSIVLDTNDEESGSDTEDKQEHAGNTDDHLDRNALIRLLGLNDRLFRLRICDLGAIRSVFRLEETLGPQVCEDFILSPLGCLGFFLLDNFRVKSCASIASLNVDAG